MKTQIVKIDPLNPQPARIKRAASVLREGGLVAFPTETVYGLGANMLKKEAIEKVYRIKSRPMSKPLTIHIAEKGAVEGMLGPIPRRARRLMDKFWPGPLTLILKAKGGRKAGFRMPDNRIALSLIKKAGVPLVAPSANISGERPPTSAQEVLEGLGGSIEMILDGGESRIGIESTVVDLSGRRYKILREGAVSEEAIKEAVSKRRA